MKHSNKRITKMNADFNELFRTLKTSTATVEQEELEQVVRDFFLSLEERDEFAVFVLSRLCGKKLEKTGRKDELRAILATGHRYSIAELAEKMSTSDKNVSSLLSYLRKEGLKICIDCEGRRFIEK